MNKKKMIANQGQALLGSPQEAEEEGMIDPAHNSHASIQVVTRHSRER